MPTHATPNPIWNSALAFPRSAFLLFAAINTSIFAQWEGKTLLLLFFFFCRKGRDSKRYCQNCQIVLLTDSALLQTAVIRERTITWHISAEIPFKRSYHPTGMAGSRSLTEGWCAGECTTSNRLKLRFRFSAAPVTGRKSPQVRRTGKLSLPAQTWWFLSMKKSHWPALVFLNTSNTNYSNSLLPAAGIWSGTSTLTHRAVSAANPLQTDHRNMYSLPCWLSRMARATNSEIKTRLPSSQSLVWPPFGSPMFFKLLGKRTQINLQELCLLTFRVTHWLTHTVTSPFPCPPEVLPCGSDYQCCKQSCMSHSTTVDLGTD